MDIKSSTLVYHPYPKLQYVDAVVVTAIAYFNEIEEMFFKTLEYPIVSLENRKAGKDFEVSI